MGRLFGTNGIRGVFGKELTLDLVLDVAYALATYFHDGPALIGYDGRYSSVILSKVVKAGFGSMGVDIGNAGLVPTPCLQYCVRKLGYKGGAMITASHNPPEYNGVKAMASDGVELSRNEELKVEDIYFGKKFKSLNHTIGNDVEEQRAIETYIEGIMSLVDVELIRRKKLKIVLDLGNGAQAVTAPRLMKSLGCSVVTINATIDGSFPGRGSEPTTENLALLSQTVRENSADLGIAYDGDGDRSVFCDEHGDVFGGDKSGAMLTDYVLSKDQGGKVVTPVNSSMLIDLVARNWNASVTRTKVGSVEVSREMVKSSASIGLEENGGFMYGKHIEVRDGAMTTALMLEMIATKSMHLSEMINSLPRFYQYKTKFACTKEQSSNVMEHLASKATNRVETLDGLKIWINDTSWIMVRQSGTEPVMRLYAESNDNKLLNELVQNYTKQISKIMHDGYP